MKQCECGAYILKCETICEDCRVEKGGVPRGKKPKKVRPHEDNPTRKKK